MGEIGVMELLVMLPMAVVRLGVPIAIIVGIVLTYRKVTRIERILLDHLVDPDAQRGIQSKTDANAG